MPLNIALEIAKADDEGVQAALTQAYTEKKLLERKLVAVRRILDQRQGRQVRETPFGRRDNFKRPLLVKRWYGSTGRIRIGIDGHLRIEVLKDMGQTEVECLVSTDDEAFTYNKHISRVAAVQEQRMIASALQRGVPEEKLAHALNLTAQTVHRKVRMLEGICAEAIGLLKDKNCPAGMFEVLKKMKPLRQIEAAELLINANNYSVSYASAILVGTPRDQLVEPDQSKRIKGISVEAMARMKSELARVQVAMTNIQDSYGRDHLQLTVVKGYLSKLLKNGPRCRQKGFEFGSSDRLFYFVTRIEILKLVV